MKKAVAVVLVMVMMLALGATAFAAPGPLSLEQAKKMALDYVGVNASEAVFTKACRGYDDGREVYEIEFFVGCMEYEMDVDVYTGTVTDFNMEYHGGYSQPYGYYDGYLYDYDDDPYDYYDDDPFDRDDDPYDYDDLYDFD